MVVWSDPPWRGVATMWPGQQSVSRPFRRVGPAGPVPWPEAPQVEIPDAGIVTAGLDPTGVYADFLLAPEQVDAAIAARVMYWIEAGRRVGVITVARAI